jgi:excisionase family DNA binding protein
MTADVPYGQGARMLALSELCEWLNITERHARKLVERDAIPYRKIGHLLRFPEAEIEEWSMPKRRPRPLHAERGHSRFPAVPRRSKARSILPKSLIE